MRISNLSQKMFCHRSNWLKAMAYFLLLGALLWLGWRAAARMVASIDYRNSDFVNYYLAARMTLQGKDPYDPQQWTTGHHDLGASWIPNPIFPYPLPLATLLAPLGWLDLYKAFVLWVVLSGVMVFATCLILLERNNNRKQAAYLLPLLAGAFLFRPTLVSFHDGQLSAWLLLITGCVAIAWSKGAWFLGGLLLGLTSLKPSLGLPLIGFAGLWLLFQRRLAALAGVAVSALTLAGIGFARDTNWPADFLQNGDQLLDVFFGSSPSLWGMSGAICQYQVRCTAQLGGLSAAIFSGVIIYYLWVNRDALDPLAAVGIAASAAVIVTPYIWAYDQLLAFVAVIASLNIAMRNRNPYLAVASYPIMLAALSAGLVLVALRIGRDHWSVLVPLISLAVLMVVVGRHRLSLRSPTDSGQA